MVDAVAWSLAAMEGLRMLLRGDPEQRIRRMIESDQVPVIRGGRDGA